MRGKRLDLKLLAIASATALAVVLLGSGQGATAGTTPLGSAFTYQGRLLDGGVPVNDPGLPMDFSLWDAAAGPDQVGSTIMLTVPVTDGLFTEQLDFGVDAFNGDSRWLEVVVDGVVLSPRQEITVAPYALQTRGLFVDDGLNVGIRTASPQALLHVQEGVSGDGVILPGLRTEQTALSPNVIGGFSGSTVTIGVVGATISGGGQGPLPNRVTDHAGTIGGGADNQAGDDAGPLNDAQYATVAGGFSNTASGNWSTVGGGNDNTASGDYSTVAGGFSNTASGNSSTIAGGLDNTASGTLSMVVGGNSNIASLHRSFAAGQSAHAIHSGAFVWGDFSTFDPIASTQAHQFTARTSGGARFFSNSAATTGVNLAPGGNSWSAISDRNVKENFSPVDARRVLEKLGAIPVTYWNLKSQDPSIQHIGPTAQDFQAAFGVGESETHISTSDADGVAFAAIQGLHQLVREKDRQIEELRGQVRFMADRLAALEALVDQLASPPDGGAK